MRRVAGITAIVVGIIMAVAGMVTWVVIGNTLSDQKIVVSADLRIWPGLRSFKILRRVPSRRVPLRGGGRRGPVVSRVGESVRGGAGGWAAC